MSYSERVGRLAVALPTAGPAFVAGSERTLEMTMENLTLVGLDDDGDYLVLRGPENTRYRLEIDDAVRAAVRRDRPRLEQLRADQASPLRPRDIQARIRAGEDAAEIAMSANLPIEHVRRFEGPVLDERQYIAERAQATTVGHGPGGTLAELSTQRFALRDVDPESVTWDAYRQPGESWRVVATFDASGTERRAEWAFDQQAHTLTALDDEAKWLSETGAPDGPIPQRRLSAVHMIDEPIASDVYALEDATMPTERVSDELLAALNDRRGKRTVVEVPTDDDDEVGLFDTFDTPGAHPAHSHPWERADAEVLELPAAAEQTADTMPVPDDSDKAHGAQPSARRTDRRPITDPDATNAVPTEEPSGGRRGGRRSNRQKRTAVPSWDEIVFGSKPE